MPFFDKYPYTNFHNVNLDWVLERVKEWGELVEQNNTAFHDLEEANEAFKSYVTSYLENLDVQEEINNKLDSMLATGVLTEYLQPYVSTSVTTWLDENITEPTGIVIDSSLTVAGACADSKVTGDKIRNVISSVERNTGCFTWTPNKYINLTTPSLPVVNSNVMTYTEIECSAGDCFIINTVGAVGGRAYAFIDSDNNILYVTPENAVINNMSVKAPANTHKLIINCKEDGIHHGICYKLGKYIDNWNSNAYINFTATATNLPVVSNATMCYARIPCTPLDGFIINTVGAVGGRAWGFADINGVAIEYAEANAIVTDLLLIAPRNAVELIINSKGDGTSHGDCYKLDNNIVSSLETIKEYVLQYYNEEAEDNNTGITYSYKRDLTNKAFYTIVNIPQIKPNGEKQYPFVLWENAPHGGNKSTYELCQNNNYIFAMNAGRFAEPYGGTTEVTGLPQGIVIQNGTNIASTAQASDVNRVLTIDSYGNLGYANITDNPQTLINNGVISAVTGFIPIIYNYENIEEYDNTVTYNTVSDTQHNILAQYDNGDYLVITTEARNNQGGGFFTVAELKELCKSYGVKFAFLLDGGGSTETVIGKRQLNPFYEMEYGRHVPTYIIFNGTTQFS